MKVVFISFFFSNAFFFLNGFDACVFHFFKDSGKSEGQNCMKDEFVYSLGWKYQNKFIYYQPGWEESKKMSA